MLGSNVKSQISNSSGFRPAKSGAGVSVSMKQELSKVPVVLTFLCICAFGANGEWSTEIVVTNAFSDARVAVSFSAGRANVLVRADGEDQPLHYYRENSEGDFVEHSLGMAYNPNNGDFAFAMRVGSDDRIRIVSCGPGGSPDRDHILFGTETSAGSATFTWEEVVSANYWPNQLGFALDQDNKAYFAVKHQPTGKCAVFDNTAGSWSVSSFSFIDPSYPRTAVAIDVGNNAWALFNGRHGGTNYLELWSNRIGSWAFEDYLTNAPEGNYEGCYFLQSVAGFEFKPDGKMVYALKPDWWSSDLEVWYGTPIPEPGGVFVVCYLTFTISCFVHSMSRFHS